MRRTVILLLGALLSTAAGCDYFRSADQLVARAAAQIEAGDYETASIELRNALQKDPENAAGRLLLAQTAFWLGEVPSAEKELERAVKAGAPKEETARLDAEIKQTLGQFQALETAMTSPIQVLPEPERLVYLGYAQLGLQQPAAALATFEAAVRSAPSGPLAAKAKLGHAQAQAAAGDSAAALAALEALRAADSKDDRVAIVQAKMLLNVGDYKAAEQVLLGLPLGKENRRLSYPEQVTAFGTLAEVQLGLGEKDAASKTIDELVGFAPGTLAVPYLKGRLALANGDTAEAITQLQTTLRGAPGFEGARMLLGVALLRQGSVAQAEAEFRRVLEDAPDNIEARKLLAESQIRQGRAEDASAVLAPAITTGSADSRVFTLAGQAKVLEGDRAKGEAYFERSQAESVADPRARLELAGSYLAMGDAKRALELVSTVPDDVGGDVKKQIQFIALASGKDAEVAKLEVEAFVKRNPGDVQLLNLAAGWLAYLGDVSGARAYLEQALKVQPKDARTLVNLGRLEITAKRLPEAGKAFEAAVVADPTMPDPYLALTLLAEQQGDKTAARKWIEAWATADPKAAQPRLMLAGMAFQASKTDEGRQLIETAIKASGNSAQAQSAAGQLLLDAGLYDEALSRFRGAMSADDKNPGYAFGAARAQLALGQREAARESLNRALAINPDWLPAVALMAQVELRDNRPDAALAQARRLEKNPKLAAAGFALEGDILMASGQAAGAADAYAQSAKLRPSAEAAVGEFRARRSANLAGPTDPLTKWLQRNPGDARVRFVLAGAYEQAGRLADAISEYEKVVQQQPDNVVAMNNLAWLYSQRKDPRAEALAKQAYAKAPNAAAVADTYGWILVQGGKVEDGLKILRQAHDLDRKIPEVEYHLGVALLKSGQKDEARRTLESAISQGKDAPWVGDARKALADAG